MPSIRWFNDKYTKFVIYEKLEERYAELQNQHEERDEKAIHIDGFMCALYEMEELPVVFGEQLRNAMVDRVIVYKDELLVYSFKSGMEVVAQL